MKRRVIGVLLLGLMLCSGAALGNTYGWTTPDTDWGTYFTEGWLVLLFEGSDTNLPSGITPTLQGTPGSDDDWTGVSAAIADSKGTLTLQSSFSTPSDVAESNYVFSAVFQVTDTGDITTGTLYQILNGVPVSAPHDNSTPFGPVQVESPDPGREYAVTYGGNPWIPVVPEPTIMSLLGIGLLTAALGYRRRRK